MTPQAKPAQEARIEIERVDHDDEITYEANYESKGFHVVFREFNHIDNGLSAKHEAYKYKKAVNNHARLLARLKTFRSRGAGYTLSFDDIENLKSLISDCEAE